MSRSLKEFRAWQSRTRADSEVTQLGKSPSPVFNRDLAQEPEVARLALRLRASPSWHWPRSPSHSSAKWGVHILHIFLKDTIFCIFCIFYCIFCIFLATHVIFN
jgi:hypothetical protein